MCIISKLHFQREDGGRCSLIKHMYKSNEPIQQGSISTMKSPVERSDDVRPEVLPVAFKIRQNDITLVYGRWASALWTVNPLMSGALNELICILNELINLHKLSNLSKNIPKILN